MRYAKLGGLGIFAATALWGGTALAQQTYQPFQVTEAKLASPASPDQQNLDLYASESYDSNVARTDAALAAERGLTQSDEITQIGFDAQIVQTLGIQRFFLKGDANYSWYANNHVLNNAFAHFNGGDTVQFGTCGVSVLGDYYRKRSDYPAVLVEDVENITTTGSIGGQLACGNKFGIAPEVSASERWNTNTAEIYRNGDSRTFTATGGLAYRSPILGSLGIFGEYNNTRYDQAILNVDGDLFRDEFSVYSGGIKYTKQFDPRFGIRAIVTYTDVGSNIPNGSDFHGITYTFDATYTPTPMFIAHANFSREVLPSDVPYATYTVNETYEAGVAYAVNRFLRLGVDAWAHTYQFRGITDVLPGVPVADQTLYQITGTATFNIYRRAWFDLYVTGQKGDVDYPGLSFWSTQVGGKIRVSFGN